MSSSEPHLGADRAVAVHTPRGATVYVDPQDGRGAELIATSGDYNPVSLDLWSALVGSHPWDVVVDVGANYGEMLVSPTMPAGADIVAFEPNSRLRPYLDRTLAEAGLDVRVEPTAVSDRPGHAVFHVDSAWSGTSSLVEDHAAGQESVQVEVTTLDKYFAGHTYRSACVKIDIEGAEAQALAGGAGFLSSVPRVAMMVEIIHQPPDVLLHIARTWRLYLFDLRVRRLVRAAGDSVERLDRLRTSGFVHQLDGVLLPLGRDEGWRPL